MEKRVPFEEFSKKFSTLNKDSVKVFKKEEDDVSFIQLKHLSFSLDTFSFIISYENSFLDKFVEQAVTKSLKFYILGEDLVIASDYTTYIIYSFSKDIKHEDPPRLFTLLNKLDNLYDFNLEVSKFDTIDDIIFKAAIDIGKYLGVTIDNNSFDNESIMLVRNELLSHLPDELTDKLDSNESVVKHSEHF